ncbi:hypothetical protein NIES2104_53840 [Leptolyngbya sp. NIES-2104]|nr:hypothetical protein NIES2104_53840 [Leptolyngbya sp. NIES-2104]
MRTQEKLVVQQQNTTAFLQKLFGDLATLHQIYTCFAL